MLKALVLQILPQQHSNSTGPLGTLELYLQALFHSACEHKPKYEAIIHTYPRKNQ